MSTFDYTVRVDTEIEVTLDTSDVLDSMDQDDILEFVESNCDDSDILGKVADDVILDHVIENFAAHDVLEKIDSEVIRAYIGGNVATITGEDFEEHDYNVQGMYVASLTCNRGGRATVAGIGMRWIVRVDVGDMKWQHFETDSVMSAFNLAKAIMAWHHSTKAAK